MPRTASTAATDGHPDLAARERFTAPLGRLELTAADGGSAVIRGHAAVYNRLSHDLGGFRTKVAPGAFTTVLDTSPDVHLLWDHDTRYTLARTANKTLELRDDPHGLHVWARLAPVSYSEDLQTLMRRGDVDQMSFACQIGSDEWHEDDIGNVTRTILDVSELYDVTVCAQGAFPQTDSRLVTAARDQGRIHPLGPVAEQAAGTASHAEASRLGVTRLRARARLARHTTTPTKETRTP